MPIVTILYLTLAAIFALGFVFFTYFFKNRNVKRHTYILGTLRFLSLLTLLLLLINPKITRTEYEIIKPELVLATDLSSSINNIDKSDSVRSFIQSIIENKELQEHFNISEYGFGEEFKPKMDKEYQFVEDKTNIHAAISQLNKLYKSKTAAVILASDGNATYGQDYEYFKTNNNISLIPILIGDTTATLDLSITSLNVNKYAFLNNKFPIEIILNYSGDEVINGNFQIKESDKIVFSKSVNLNKNKTSEVITTNLSANKIGVSIYEASFTSQIEEKNESNNQRKFAIEVINEKTKVLILYDITHPDLGTLKNSVEQNEQREVILKAVKDFKISELSDFQLVVLYQPNNKFRSILTKLNRIKSNRFIITGTQTDWNFLNASQDYFSKSVLGQTQDLFPIYNKNYLQYQFEDIGFRNFPPIEDAFGSLRFDVESSNTLLYQKVEGIETSQPLLSVIENNQVKTGVLFGENIWKWRAQTFKETQSFELFDEFIGKYIQYLSSNKKRERLTYECETVFLENDKIVLTAQFFDENYVFDPNGELNIYLKNRVNGESFEAQLLPNPNFYKVEIEDLKPGDYNFIVKEQRTGISKNGNFTVLEFNVEQQFTAANFEKFNFLANNNEGRLYFLKEQEELITDLIQDKRFVSVQKSHEKNVPLINWKFLLFLLALSLSVEWFTRKYFGLI